MSSDSSVRGSRRKVLKLAGLSGIATLAGCSSGGGTQTENTPDGSGSDDKYGGTLRVGISGTPGSLHIGDNTSVYSRHIIGMISNSWVHYDFNENKLVPGAVTEWEWNDDTTARLKIREGMQFHGGYGEVTAEDFVHLTNLIVNKPLAQKFLWTGRVKGAKKVDKYTFDVAMNQTFGPFFVTGPANAHVASKKAIEEMGEEYSQNPISQGPYVFKERVQGSRIVVERFDDYWGGDDDGVLSKGYPDKVVFRIIPESSTRMDLLRSGELDVADRAAYKDIDSIKEEEGLEVRETPGWNFEYFSVGGQATGHEALNDTKIRQAISYAVDRKELIENAFFGHGLPDDDPLPPTIDQKLPDGDPQHFPNEARPEKAKELMAEAGWGDGFSIEFKHTPRTDKRRSAQIIASQLGNVGIDVSLKQVDNATMENVEGSGGYDLLYHDISLMSPDPDAASYWFFHNEASSLLDMGYEKTNPEHAERVTELLDKQRATTDQQKRMEIFQEIFNIVIPDAPYVFTGHVSLPRVMGPNARFDAGRMGRGDTGTFTPMDQNWKGLRHVYKTDNQ